MASSPQVTTAVVKPRRTLARRLLAWGLAFVVLVVVLFAVAVLNNNYSPGKRSRAQFNAQLDRAIEASTQWIVQHPDTYGNPSLMFMVGDMADMSLDPRLRQFVENYVASNRVRIPGRPITWYYARLVDPQARVPMISAEQSGVGWELQWDTWATAPDRMLLNPADRADMFSPTKYIWGRRDHQLLALDIYRHFNGQSAELDQAIGPVSEGVARDAHWDFRVTDAYYQRSAFVLGAGRPELIRRRWIERILDYQKADGSWSYCWYGWCRGIFEFRMQDSDPGHATVQATWALYMLKYRYSQWIDQHYR